MAKEKKEEKKSAEKAEPQERKKALQTALDAIHKTYGNGSIMTLGSKPVGKIEAISTGCISLDDALGVGGVPKGRIIEISGAEAGGKSTLCMQIVAEVQRQGGTAAYIDAEHSLSLPYAKSIGVDVANLQFSQPDSGEEALEIAEMLTRSGAVDIIIIDSTAALVPRAEIEGEMGDPTMGALARLMSQALRKLTSVVGKTKTILIFVCQIRSKIGVMFGPTETVTGGNALKFYASVRLDVRKVEVIKEGTEVIGVRSRIKVVKNKVAPPFRETTVDIIFGQGISRESDLLDVAVGRGVIEKAGTWYSYKEERIGQGRDDAVGMLKKDPILYDNILQDVVNPKIEKEKKDEKISK